MAGWHGTSTDIHERKQAELDARSSLTWANSSCSIDPAEWIATVTRAVGEIWILHTTCSVTST